jgi:hypothetical protein
MTHWIGWLELVLEEALLVLALLIVFDGCKRMARDGISRTPALMVAVGLILPVWEASASLHLINNVQRLQAEKQAALYTYGREPAGGWEKATMSPEDRMAMSNAVATINYKFMGRQLDVIDAQGNRVPLALTPALVAEREQIVRDEKGAEDSGESAFDRGVHLFISTAGFMLAGFAVGWRQRKRA